ncbi:hypothetical protein DL768_010366 [Monosporascus sp. mg162]|nr:hypothetical protein DL768_010366 [Monosporascus sp. mg162]
MAANTEGFGQLRPDSDTLSPLPDFHRKGLIAISVLGTMSFISSGTLFLYLVVRLGRWYLQAPSAQEQPEEDHAASNDLSLGLAQKNFGRGQPKLTDGEGLGGVQDLQQQNRQPPKKKAPNQFLILILNLLLADMHQGTAFMLSARWVRDNEITVGTRTCWTQGWFVSNGDLSSSCFTGAVAVYTYLIIVKNWKPPYRLLYSVMAALWVFVYFMGVLGVLVTQNGKNAGGLYVRAAAWCWLNIEYENYRLWFHYFWIFLSLALTTVLYSLIFYHLRPRSSSASQSSSGGQQQDREPSSASRSSNSHPAFLIYPLIYVSCTAPLALGRIATMAGVNVSITYFCVAGGLIASNGFLDVLLFSTTRHLVLFNAPADSDDTGLSTFAFMRTPRDRQYGNMVWVQGGARNAPSEGGKPRGRRKNGSSGWERIGERIGWGTRRSHYKSTSREWVGGPGSVSQESLRGGGGYMADNGIHMDTVTTVVVEVEQDKKPYLSRAASAFSGEESDKTVEQQARGL